MHAPPFHFEESNRWSRCTEGGKGMHLRCKEDYGVVCPSVSKERSVSCSSRMAPPTLLLALCSTPPQVPSFASQVHCIAKVYCMHHFISSLHQKGSLRCIECTTICIADGPIPHRFSAPPKGIGLLSETVGHTTPPKGIGLLISPSRRTNRSTFLRYTSMRVEQ